MATLNIAQVAQTLREGHLSPQNAFDVLACLGRESSLGDRDVAREMLIRVLGQRRSVPGALVPLLQSLIREHGLFPYLSNTDVLTLADRLAFEAHRPDGPLGEELVFHSEQSLVYDHLMAGENVVLSAPTSFGKSLVVDAYLDAGGFDNAVVIVPTIALMDETRRRMRRLTGPGRYKIITHASQPLGARNLLIMTQERFLQFGPLENVQFFIIDEFYKLDLARAANDPSTQNRASQLNVVFDRLRRTGAQYYLLGPNITALEKNSESQLRATFITTGFTTVATDVERVHAPSAKQPDELAAQCRTAGAGTVVFCSSPARTGTVARWLLERGVGFASLTDDKPLEGDQSGWPIPSTDRIGSALDPAGVGAAADWVADTYHPDWIVARALRLGVGIHHGQLPRALGHHMVRLFNEGRLPYLLVTSTLIEGVNTSARTVIVLDHTIANRKYDYFTYANIRGRSGRMSKHFVGRVVVFNPEPTRADLTVDIPALSQSKDASVEMLIHLPYDELTPASRKRLEPFQDLPVSTDTLRANRGVRLERQVAAAQAIAQSPERYRRALRWTGGYPTSGQIKELGELLVTMTGTSAAVKSARQLAAKINILRFHRGDLRALIARDVEYGLTPDEAVGHTLGFVRNYAQFNIPSAMSAATSIARDVLDADDLTNPEGFLAELENVFQPRFATVLEEVGLPTSVAVKLRNDLGLDQAADLDDVLNRLRALQVTSVKLSTFEAEMVRDTQATL